MVIRFGACRSRELQPAEQRGETRILGRARCIDALEILLDSGSCPVHKEMIEIRRQD